VNRTKEDSDTHTHTQTERQREKEHCLSRQTAMQGTSIHLVSKSLTGRPMYRKSDKSDQFRHFPVLLKITLFNAWFNSYISILKPVTVYSRQDVLILRSLQQLDQGPTASVLTFSLRGAIVGGVELTLTQPYSCRYRLVIGNDRSDHRRGMSFRRQRRRNDVIQDVGKRR